VTDNHATRAIALMGLDDFLATYSISATRADGLISLKYNQIESPMHESCVADCRGLVVDEADPTRIVCMGYRKFWNLGEKYADAIEWSTARVLEKLDGSLMMLYRWQGRWCVASSGTPDAGGPFGDADGTFADAFWSTWRSLGYRLPDDTDPRWFFFEFCAPTNRIVVRYDRPRLVLHGARHAHTLIEVDEQGLTDIGTDYGWEVVSSAPAHDAADLVAKAAATDPLALEGFVVVDAGFRRVKVKNPRYVEIHHLRGNRSPRSVIELWKAGEVDEVLAHFPEMAPDFDAVLTPLRAQMERAGHAWRKHAGIDDRKAFAGAVKSEPLSAVLFRLYSDRPAGDPDTAIEKVVRGLTTPAVLRAVGAKGDAA
jgi:hypothetical protein